MSDDFSLETPDDSQPSSTTAILPGFLPAAILFSLAAVLLLTIGTRVQQKSILIGLLITEFILIALPPILFSLLKKYSLKECFRFCRIKLSNVLLIVLCSLMAYPVAIGLSLLSLVLIKVTLGDVTALNLPIPPTGAGLAIYLLVVAGSAALCEEILFRGFIQTGLKGLGALPCIVLTALLFGLFHVDITRFAGTFFLGLLLSFYVYRTGSILASMTAHFTNNAIAVLFQFLSSKLASVQSAELYTKPFENSTPAQLIALVITGIFLIVFFGGMLAALLFALVKNTKDSVSSPPSLPTQKKRTLFLLFPGLCMICLVLFAQALVYSGTKVPWILELLKNISGV